jgi:hypothetical protein
MSVAMPDMPEFIRGSPKDFVSPITADALKSFIDIQIAMRIYVDDGQRIRAAAKNLVELLLRLLWWVLHPPVFANIRELDTDATPGVGHDHY